jgi:hypothetical protein
VTTVRSALAVAAGFGFMMSAGLVGGSVSTVVARLAVSLLGAVIAGWIAARLAPFAPFKHAVVLAVIVAAVAMSMIRSGPAGAPGFTMMAGSVAVAGILLGGGIRAAAGSARATVD